MTKHTLTATLPLRERIVNRIWTLPRFARILFLAVCALIVTLVLTPAIDYIYLSQFFDFNTRMSPSLISTGIGIVTYGVGWWLFLGDTPHYRAGFLYLAVSLFALIAGIILVVFGGVIVALSYWGYE